MFFRFVFSATAYPLLVMARENSCLQKKMKIVTQQALLVQMTGKIMYHVHKLHVNKLLERDLYPSVRLLGVSGQPHSSSWKCSLSGVTEEGQAGLMNEYC